MNHSIKTMPRRSGRTFCPYWLPSVFTGTKIVYWVALQPMHCRFNRVFAYHLCRDIVLDSIFVHGLHAVNCRFNVPTIFFRAWKKCEITERLTFRILFHTQNSNLNNALLLVVNGWFCDLHSLPLKRIWWMMTIWWWWWWFQWIMHF